MFKNAVVFTVLILSFSVAYAQQSKALSWVFGERGNVNMRYSVMDRSPQGLLEYKQRMMIVHQEAEKTPIKYFLSTVTFQRPLLPDDALGIIEKYKVAPKLVYVFASSVQGGEIITLGVRPDPENFSGSIRDTINLFEGESGARVIGVVAVIGYMETSELRPMQLDDRMFLVDISADENLADNPGNRHYMHHFGWDLYQQQAR